VNVFLQRLTQPLFLYNVLHPQVFPPGFFNKQFSTLVKTGENIQQNGRRNVLQKTAVPQISKFSNYFETFKQLNNTTR